MKCPICGAWTRVKETRVASNNSRKRRIECGNLHRFSTLEIVIVSETPVRQKQKAA